MNLWVKETGRFLLSFMGLWKINVRSFYNLIGR